MAGWIGNTPRTRIGIYIRLPQIALSYLQLPWPTVSIGHHIAPNFILGLHLNLDVLHRVLLSRARRETLTCASSSRSGCIKCTPPAPRTKFKRLHECGMNTKLEALS